VVFDILRATSSIVTGLEHGLAEAWPVKTIEEALELHATMPDAVLAGERFGDPIPGFAVGNNPLDYRGLAGRRIITTTTNGTIAFRACEQASLVLAGALLNLAALRDVITAAAPEELLLVCAGTFETFALEDAIAAGLLADAFSDAACTDATRAVQATAHAFSSPLEGLLAARNGQALLAKGWREQIEWCAQLSRFRAVGAMSGGVIRPLPPA
jgi:2-phosphosulfolactate phosphatase